MWCDPDVLNVKQAFPEVVPGFKVTHANLPLLRKVSSFSPPGAGLPSLSLDYSHLRAQSFPPPSMSELSLNPPPLVLIPQDLPRPHLSTGTAGGMSGIKAALRPEDDHVRKELQSFPGESSTTHQWKQLVFLFLPSTLLAEIQKAPRAIQPQSTIPLSFMLEALGSLEAWPPCQLR